MSANRALKNPYLRDNPFNKPNKMYNKISKYNESSLKLSTLTYKPRHENAQSIVHLSMIEKESLFYNQYLPQKNHNKITEFEKLIKTETSRFDRKKSSSWDRPHSDQISLYNKTNPFYRKNLLQNSWEKPIIYDFTINFDYQRRDNVNRSDKNNPEKNIDYLDKKIKGHKQIQQDQTLKITSRVLENISVDNPKQEQIKNNQPDSPSFGTSKQNSIKSSKLPKQIYVHGKKYFLKKVVQPS